MYESVVVGGGPVGCIAAKALTKYGDTAVVEEHNSQPVQCAGLISRSGIEKLNINAGDSILNNICGARFYSPNGTTIELDSRETKAYVVDRQKFDEILLEGACDSGARLIESRVNDVRDNTLITSHGKVRSSNVIIACGTDYTLPRKLGLETPKEFLIGAQYEMKVSCDSDFVELHFVVPDFFAWIIPVGDYARVGLCTKSNPTPHLDGFVGKLKRAGRIKKDKIRDKMFGIIPLHDPKIRADYGSIKTVGDTAGQVKASTGGGVVMGGMAAQYVHYSDYGRRWRDAVGRELRLHLAVHRFLSKLSPSSMDRLFEVLGRGKTSLEGNADMDYASKTLTALARNPSVMLNFILNTPRFIFDVIR